MRLVGFLEHIRFGVFFFVENDVIERDIVSITVVYSNGSTITHSKITEMCNRLNKNKTHYPVSISIMFKTESGNKTIDVPKNIVSCYKTI